MPITATIALYGAAWLLLLRAARRRLPAAPKLITGILALGLVTHAYAIYSQIVLPEGFQLSFLKISSVFFWTAVGLVLVSSLRNPLHNLFIVMLPVTILALLGSLYATKSEIKPAVELSAGMITHIFLSILAYSTMIVATFQALLLAFQNYKLKHKHPGGLVRLLPPLQTMESLLFELLWIGQILLTAVIVTGVTKVSSVSEQHLHHKIFFTAIAWVIYAILLWGRHSLGWRGNAAIRWTLSGFAFLLLAYLGSQLVLELILDAK